LGRGGRIGEDDIGEIHTIAELELEDGLRPLHARVVPGRHALHVVDDQLCAGRNGAGGRDVRCVRVRVPGRALIDVDVVWIWRRYGDVAVGNVPRGPAGGVAEQAVAVLRDLATRVQPAAVRRRVHEADVVVAGIAGALARLVLPVVRQRHRVGRRAPMTFHTVPDVLRVRHLVRFRKAGVRPSRHLEVFAHVDLVDEDREVQESLVVDHGHVPGPRAARIDRRRIDPAGGRRVSFLIVVARGAGADVVADAAVELTGSELPGGAGDGPELRVALEAGCLVDLLVLPGHLRAGCGNEVLHEVDGRERVAGRVEEDD